MARRQAHLQNHPAPGDGRQALLDGVIAVVARRGLRGLTYRAVAEEAGVTHASVTHHFQSRDRLILEAYAASSRPIGYISSNSDRLEDFGDGFVDTVRKEEELLAFQYELLLEARRRPELVGDIEQMYAKSVAEMSERLEAFGCVDEDASLASFVLAVLDGLLLQHLVLGQSETSMESLRILKQFLATTRQNSDQPNTAD